VFKIDDHDLEVIRSGHDRLMNCDEQNAAQAMPNIALRSLSVSSKRSAS
jgi:hypothetical protein